MKILNKIFVGLLQLIMAAPVGLYQISGVIYPDLSHWRQAYFLVTAFKRKAFNAQAAWLRCLNGAALLTNILFFKGVRETGFSLL